MVGVVCTEDGMEIVTSQPWIVSPPALPTATQAGFLDCPEEAKVSGFRSVVWFAACSFFRDGIGGHDALASSIGMMVRPVPQILNRRCAWALFLDFG